MAYSDKDKAALIEWIDRKRRADQAHKIMSAPRHIDVLGKPSSGQFMQTVHSEDPYLGQVEQKARRALLVAGDGEIRRLSEIICTVLPWPENSHSPLTPDEIKMLEEQGAPWAAAMARLVEIAEGIEREEK